MLRLEFTVFRKSNGSLSKRIFLDQNGTAVSDGSACSMACGQANREVIQATTATETIEQLAKCINRMSSEDALALGVLKDDLPNAVEITVQGREDPAIGLVPRSQDFLVYRPGKPAFMLCDFDKKGIPQG